MTLVSKRMQIISKEIDRDIEYDAIEAISLLKKLTSVRFRESVDISVNLGINPKKSDQSVRGSTVLPHGIGKIVRVVVFAQGELVQAAIDAGADRVGTDDLVTHIQQGHLDFDVVIAEPSTMRIVGQLGRLLGPRGLMPNPKVGTVTTDVATAVRNAKAGQVQYRNDRTGVVHSTIGKVNFSIEALKENLDAILADLIKAKPSTAKGVYLKQVSLSTTMGPGLRLNKASLSI